MTDRMNLSSSQIRYLLAMKELSDKNGAIRSIKLASELGCSKPSVHTMIRTLSAMDLVEKEPYGAVYFTLRGKKTAEHYARYYDAVQNVLGEYTKTDSTEAEEAICALLAGMTEECLKELWMNRQTKLNGEARQRLIKSPAN